MAVFPSGCTLLQPNTHTHNTLAYAHTHTPTHARARTHTHTGMAFFWRHSTAASPDTSQDTTMHESSR